MCLNNRFTIHNCLSNTWQACDNKARLAPGFIIFRNITLLTNALTTFSFAFGITAPIFVVLFLGMLLKKRGMIDDGFIKSASGLVYTIGLPIMLFTTSASADFNHMADVGVQQGVDVGAVAARRILKSQQCADLVQAHVQAAAVAHKLQPLGVGVRIMAVVGIGAGSCGQQALALVVADGFHRGGGGLGQIADRLSTLDDIAVIRLEDRDIVRHPLVGRMQRAFLRRAALAGESPADVMRAGLKPIGRKTAANAKRLGKLGPAMPKPK